MRAQLGASTMLVLAMLLSGCFLDPPCTQFPTAATAEFPWNGTKEELVAAFAAEGWAVEEGPTHQVLSLEKEFDGSRVRGSATTRDGYYPGVVRMSLTTPEPKPTTRNATEDLYRTFLPGFAEGATVDPLPSSRHCGAI